MRHPRHVRVSRVALVVTLAVLLAAGYAATARFVRAAAQPWMNTSLSPDQRANLLIAQMTLDEKIAELHGASGSAYVGYVPANTRLGIPALYLEDGPAGVADGMTGVTQLPAPVAGAASWDPSLMRQYGSVLGAEEAGKGTNVTLAPTINITRDPRWGRAFESIGEDPYLNGQMGAADIQGIQSQGEIAQVKHWAVYNQETYRNTSADNAVVSDRTMQEIYFPAFQAAIDQGKVGSIMCSYSTINGAYACQNSYLNQVLRQQFQFPGFNTSDWGATHSTVQSANNGLDMQMPDDSYYGAALKAAVQSGKVSMATLDQHVHNILRTMFALGLFDRPHTGSPSATVTSPQHTQTALQTAENGTVLLKNDGNALPLNTSKVHSIAVIGDDAGSGAQTAGGGSASVNAPYVVTPYQGISKRAGSGVQVQYAQGVAPNNQLPVVDSQYFTPASGSGNGLTAQFYNNMTLSGTPVLTRNDPTVNFNWNGGSPGAGVNATQWSVKWTGTLTPPTTGSYTFSLTSDDGSRLFINGQKIIDNWRDQGAHTQTGSVNLTATQPVQIEVDYYQNGGASLVSMGWQIPGGPSLQDQAVQLAKTSDIAIVFASDFETEGADLATIDLPGAQNQLIEAVAAANPNTIVVLNTGSAVTMPWVNSVKGIVEAWYPGQEDGNAIAAVLFGDVNPSGKLPVTFPKSLADVPASTPQQWPGVTGQVQYSEGLLVGYRWYDAKNITPLFPFGYGLSYTTFSFSNLVVAPQPASYKSTISVDADVTNTGSRAGAEVVQLYLGDPATTGEPPKQLEGFQKLTLNPGQSQHVHFTLDPRAFSYWDSSSNSWVVADGTYQVFVGDSSRTLPLQGSFDVRTTDGPRYVTVKSPGVLTPGSPATVTTSFTNGGDIAAHQLNMTLQVPSGWTANATTPASFQTVDGSQTVTTTWSVTQPANAQPGTFTFTGVASYVSEGGKATNQASATAQLPYSSLAQAYNNVGISDNSNPSAGNLDGNGYSYSAQALAQVGLTPGASVGGVFTWPNVPAGTPDNVQTAGQVVRVTGSGSYLGFLGTATFGTENGAGTITYTDGSSQAFTLRLADWYANSPANGGQIVATAPDWNAPPTNTLGSHAVSVYYAPVALQSGKTVEYVTLPNDANEHVFAMAVTNTAVLPFSSLRQAFNDVGITDNSNTGPGNFGGAGYSYSAQGLAAVGLTPGQPVTTNGVTFTWPNVAAGTPDNVVPSGQQILFSGSGSTLGFIGSGNNGEAKGTGTITYTDGSTQQFTLDFADWYWNGAVSGGGVVATTPNWNAPSNAGSHAVSIYYWGVSLAAGKTIQSVTLPSTWNMHIFAMAAQ